MNEFDKIKEQKLSIVCLNFRPLLRANGRKFLVDILIYIYKINKAKTVLDLNSINIELGKPLDSEIDTSNNVAECFANEDDINQYFNRKLKKLFLDYLNNSLTIMDDLDEILYNEIVLIRTNKTSPNLILNELVRKSLSEIETL